MVTVAVFTIGTDAVSGIGSIDWVPVSILLILSVVVVSSVLLPSLLHDNIIQLKRIMQEKQRFLNDLIGYSLNDKNIYQQIPYPSGFRRLQII